MLNKKKQMVSVFFVWFTGFKVNSLLLYAIKMENHMDLLRQYAVRSIKCNCRVFGSRIFNTFSFRFNSWISYELNNLIEWIVEAGGIMFVLGQYYYFYYECHCFRHLENLCPLNSMSHRQNRFVAIIDWLDFAIIFLQLLPVIIHEVKFFCSFICWKKEKI